MPIIRFNTDDVFQTDSSEYEILTNAAASIKGVPGGVVEIGTRRGGSAVMMMQTLAQNDDTDRLFICIDPYGNIPIECTHINLALAYGEKHEDENAKDKSKPKTFDYTNNMRNRVIPSLYYVGYELGFNFQFHCLEDFEFFDRYLEGVPVYNNGKRIEDKFALSFIDGPHTNDAVLMEMEYFNEKAPPGAMTVHDDIWMINQDEIIEPWLFERGWELVEKGRIKASYRKKG